MFPSTYVSQWSTFVYSYLLCFLLPVSQSLCFKVAYPCFTVPIMYLSTYVLSTYVSQYLCFLPMFPSISVSQESTHVSLYLSCFSVPMFASRLLFPTTYLCFQVLMLFIFPSPYASRYLLFPSPIMFLSTYMFSSSLPMFPGTYVS